MIQGRLRYILGINVARAKDAIVKNQPYSILYSFFGFTCHLDQNEKIRRRYGGAHVD